MSVRKIKAFEYTCDGCAIKVVTVGDEDARGYHGTAVQVSDTGRTNGFDWYACSNECIQPAVENAIERGMQS